MQDQVDFILDQWGKERPDLDASVMGVVGRVSRLAKYIDQSLTQNFAKHDLNRWEFDVLATLLRSGAPYQLTPKVLLNALMLSSGAMTNRLDRLEDAGYIERSPHPTDRRGVYIKLTDQGFEKINKAIESHVAHEHQLLESLSDNEKGDLALLLKKVLLSFGDQVEID